MNTPWVHKYAPKDSSHVVGQDEALAVLKQYIANYKPGAKPVLLCSGPGRGKTSTVHALAHELDLELLEVNASDARNKDAIEMIVGGATKQQSLFFRKKIILIDEVDGVSGTQDRGGVAALVALLATSRFPIIFTANDAEEDKLKVLVKASVVVELADISPEKMKALLSSIAVAEKLEIDDAFIGAIARRSGGDMRSAINDLQSLATGKVVTKQDVDELEQREVKETVESALLRVFKTTTADVALPAFDNVDEDVDKIILWMDENIPREYKSAEDLARAFDALAEADRYFGRIRRWQYYRFYVYIYNLLSAGIALAKEKKYPGATDYKPTGRILKMWIYNQKNAKRKKLAQALSPHLHTSSRRLVQDVLPLMRYAAQHDKALAKRIATQYGLDAESVEWLA